MWIGGVGWHFFKTTERGVRYPTLIKLVKGLLSVFTGPLGEGPFN